MIKRVTHITWFQSGGPENCDLFSSKMEWILKIFHVYPFQFPFCPRDRFSELGDQFIMSPHVSVIISSLPSTTENSSSHTWLLNITQDWDSRGWRGVSGPPCSCRKCSYTRTTRYQGRGWVVEIGYSLILDQISGFTSCNYMLLHSCISLKFIPCVPYILNFN